MVVVVVGVCGCVMWDIVFVFVVLSGGVVIECGVELGGHGARTTTHMWGVGCWVGVARGAVEGGRKVHDDCTCC